MTPNLTQVLSRLDDLTNWERRPRVAMRGGLAAMGDLMARLGDPHKAFRSVHVAGTKGKGSVCALIEAALVGAGVSVGRYASPHVVDITERVSLLGRAVEAAALARTLAQALDAFEAAKAEGGAGGGAVWFDLLTAAAFLLFRDAGVEWAVVEVGIGGRLDSTNIVTAEVAVVTNIELEHTEILGDTREAIASEKVGILKPGALLATTLTAEDGAGRVLQETADRLGCAIARTPPTLGATIEATNAALAGLALEQLGGLGVRAQDGRRVGAGMLDPAARARARLPGRLERFEMQVEGVTVKVVLDGAHVPFNLAAVLRDLARQPGLEGPCVALVALASDKDAHGFVTELARRARAAVFTRSPLASRARSPSELALIAATLGLPSEVEEDPYRALARALELAAQFRIWLLVTGSMYLVGAFRGKADAKVGVDMSRLPPP